MVRAMSQVYRRAEVGDIPDLMSIRNGVRENALVSTVLTEDDYVQAMTTDGRAWLCEVDGETAGFVNPRDVQGDIWALFVRERDEGRGIGSALMDIAERWMFDRGLQEIRLVTSPDTKAERLYRARGWTFVGMKDTGEAQYVLSREQWSAHGGKPCELRDETAADIDAIRAVNVAAFAGEAEANLVDALREHGRVLLSLVARRDGRVVGHLLASPASIVGEGRRTPCAALGPMAVAPDMQSRGIGSQLMRRVLDRLRDGGHRIVVLLGHPDYYPRFGFEPGAPLGIRCPYDAPDEAWLVLGLQPGSLDGVAGVVEYAPEFAEV